MSRPLRVGSRASALARQQTVDTLRALRRRHPDLRIELIPMTTQGDRPRRRGVSPDFTGTLEAALRRGTIDLAVHSAKDLSARDPPDLVVAAYPARADPRDCWIAGGRRPLPFGARVGTSSLRRHAQLARWRPDLRIEEVRGNVDTRIGLVRSGKFDAIVVAKAGIDRLHRSREVSGVFPVSRFLPPPGQGALALQARRNDRVTRARVRAIDHAPTRAAVEAERSLADELGASCNVPLGAFARLQRGRLRLIAEILTVDGSRSLRVDRTGSPRLPRGLARSVARRLVAAGARPLISSRPST